MTTTERIDAICHMLETQAAGDDEILNNDAYEMLIEGKDLIAILEALRFQKAALGEPSDEVINRMVEEVMSPNHVGMSWRNGAKAMIAELAKQVKGE